jgi:hypothetical protein
MAMKKHPKRVSGDARPKSGIVGEGKQSDVVEVAKLNGEFRKWGPFWGPILYWLSIKAARPRSFLWTGWIGLGAVVGGLVLKYGLAAFAG